jgi:nuclear GTP-binding protein
LERVKKEYIEKTYGVEKWEDHIDFLTKVAKKSGRLLKGGEPDLDTVAKMIIFDWQRGKIPFFVGPPFDDERPKSEEETSEVYNLYYYGLILIFILQKKELPTVNQKFNKISVTAEFNNEDLTSSVQKDNNNEEEPDWDEVYKSNLPDEDNEEEEDVPKAPEPDSEEDIEEDIDPLLKSTFQIVYRVY